MGLGPLTQQLLHAASSQTMCAMTVAKSRQTGTEAARESDGFVQRAEKTLGDKAVQCVCSLLGADDLTVEVLQSTLFRFRLFSTA